MNNGGRVRAVVGESLRNPLLWAGWAGGLVFGLASDHLLLALGAAAALHGATVALALRDPRAWNRLAARRRLERLQEDAAHLDGATRVRLGAILDHHAAICRACLAPDVPAWARDPFRSLLDRSERLIAQASDLSLRRAALSACIEGVNASELHGQRASLQARCRRSEDPVQRAQLEQSLRFKDQEIEAYDTISRNIARVDGQLESLECAFAALKARLLRFGSDDKAEWSASGEQLGEEMNALSTRMDTLNDSVREVLALRGGA